MSKTDDSDTVESLRGRVVSASEYQEVAGRSLRERQHHLTEVPQVIAAMEAEQPTVVWLQCSKGHRLMQVTLNPDHNWNPLVGPASDTPVSPEEQVARSADMFNRAGGVCSVNGCPEVVPKGVDTCDEHGSMVTDELDGMRHSFTCQTCGRKSVLRQERLLTLYAAALVQGRKKIRLD